MAEAKRSLSEISIEALDRSRSGQTPTMANPIVITLARQSAIKAVQAQLKAQGLKPVYIDRQTIVAAANAYLREHPELIERAAETVRKDTQLRTLAEREERRRKENRR